MDTNELMELAREAGLEVHIAGAASCIHSLGVRAVTFDDMHKFAALVEAKTKERCAHACDIQSFRFATSDADDKRCYAARECALSILAMKD